MAEQQFEGRSVAEAAIKACEALSLTRSSLIYKVVSETGENLNRHVVIAVTLPTVPTLKNSEKPAALSSKPPVKAPTPLVEPESMNEEDALDAKAYALAHATPTAPVAQSVSRPAPRSRRGRNSGNSSNAHHGNRGGDGHRAKTPRASSASTADNSIDHLLTLIEPTTTPARRAAIEPASEKAKQAVLLVSDIVRLMGLSIETVLVEQNPEQIYIDLLGDEENRIIGKKGEVLYALQFVVNRLMGRVERESESLVVLDAGGYRERRRLALEDLARRLAHKALEQRKAVRLSPMSAHDRRIFHVTLKAIEGITTHSEGDGLYRSMLIIPSEFC